MAAIGAAVVAIASAVSSVVSTVVSVIASVISSIAAVVASVVSAIATTVWGVISAIGAFVWRAISALYAVISSAAVKVFSGIVSGITSVIKAIATPLQAIYHTIKTLVGSIGSVIKSIYGSVSNYLRSILSSIRNIVTSITNPIRTVIGKIREVYSAIKASIIGKILKVVKEVSDFVSIIFTIVQVGKAFGKRQYLKAIYLLAMAFDEKLAKDIKETKAYIESNITSLIRDIDSIFITVRRDISGLYQYSGYLEEILRGIGEFLGVKALEDIAQGLERFRQGFLDHVKRAVTDAEETMRGWIAERLHPLYAAFREITMAEREYRDYQRIFNFLTLRDLQPGIYGYTPSKMVMYPYLRTR